MNALVLLMRSAAHLSSITSTPPVRTGKVLPYYLRDDGSIPNSHLPLLHYLKALDLPDTEPAITIEKLFAANRWGRSWRNGIYTFHHYHSTAHEVLAVYAGQASVQLGGETGIKADLNRGDVVLIPAGVAHKNLGHSPDFAVVGAYPEGQTCDMCYGKPDERPEADKNIAAVPLPASDPVYGATGPLFQYWPRNAAETAINDTMIGLRQTGARRLRRFKQTVVPA